MVENVKELQEEMRCYLSSDEEVLKGVVSPEEMSTIPTEEADPQSATTPASTPEEQVTARTVREPAAERKAPKYLGWEKVLHPSQPVTAAAQIPQLLRGPRLRLCDWEERMVQVP